MFILYQHNAIMASLLERYVWINVSSYDCVVAKSWQCQQPIENPKIHIVLLNLVSRFHRFCLRRIIVCSAVCWNDEYKHIFPQFYRASWRDNINVAYVYLNIMSVSFLLWLSGPSLPGSAWSRRKKRKNWNSTISICSKNNVFITIEQSRRPRKMLCSRVPQNHWTALMIVQ